MRLRNVPEAPGIIEASFFCIKDPEGFKGRWHEAFPKSTPDTPLHIEIGTGKGKFLLAMAKEYPDINFIGIERYESVLYKAALAIEKDPLSNLKFICGDAAFLDAFFEKREVDRIYLNFSDPWPKERHAKRRLTSPGFLKKYAEIMSADASLEFKTDNRGLFDYSIETIKEYEGFKITALTYNLHHDEEMNCGNIMTEYEEKFSSRGNDIFKLIAKPCASPSDNGF